MDKTQREDSRKINPRIVEVGLYALMEDGHYDASRMIRVSSAQLRPIDADDEPILKKVSAEIDRGVWSLWIPTFSTKWSSNLQPMSIQVRKHWLIKEAVGGKEWAIVSIRREKSKMCWRCLSLEFTGDSQLR